jgi:DNA-binding beta-propeller fold protein YncE
MRTAGLTVPLLLAAPLLGQTVVNTIPHLGSFAGAVAYDAVTNEVVVVDETASTVTFYDRVSHAQVHQYPAPAGSLPIGAQIDVSTGRLWVVGENEIVYEIDRSGTIVQSWSCAPTITDASALALDPFSDTVWISNDSANIVAEFTRAGVATLNQFTPAGSTDGDGLAYDPVSRTFLLGEDTANQILVVDRTGAQVAVFPVAGLGISPEGLDVDSTTGIVFVGHGLAPSAVFELAGVLAAPAPASVTRFGTPCGAARLGVSGALRDDGSTGTGTWIGYQGALPAGSPFLFVVGLAQQNLPLAGILSSPCTAYAFPDVASFFGLTNANRRVGFRLPAPPGALGVSVTLWGADFDLTSFAIPSSSDGIQLVVL